MQIQDRIHAWLESERNYEEGVILLSLAGGRKNQVRYLSKEPTDYRREKLAYVLEKKLEELPPVTKSARKKGAGLYAVLPASQDEKTPFGNNPPQVTTDDYPDSIREAVQKRKGLYKERTALHGKLDESKSDDKRKELADRIVEITEEIAGLWEIEDKFKADGTVPQPPAAATATELMQKRNNIRSNISRTKTKLKAAKTAETKAKHQNKINDLEAELTEVETKMTDGQ